MYTSENGEQLLHGDWDMVIDAIDDVPTKSALLACCIDKHLRVISCMGAGGKSDVTRLHISDLRTASRDPLASKLRQHLKRILPGNDSYMDKMEQLAVVYSSEKTVMKLADFTEEQKAAPHDYGAVDGMRIRVLPVLGTMPAVMGMTCAAMALCELGDKPFSVCDISFAECECVTFVFHSRFLIVQPVTGERVGRNVRNR
jgi:tRNA A37 threonylcarbamoyladenosine dehydratase